MKSIRHRTSSSLYVKQYFVRNSVFAFVPKSQLLSEVGRQERSRTNGCEGWCRLDDVRSPSKKEFFWLLDVVLKTSPRSPSIYQKLISLTSAIILFFVVVVAQLNKNFHFEKLIKKIMISIVQSLPKYWNSTKNRFVGGFRRRLRLTHGPGTSMIVTIKGGTPR